MTIKEACLKVLETEKRTFNYKEVYAAIIKHDYYVWDTALTPVDTVSAQLSDLIKYKDNRVKRVKGKSSYQYYWAKYEEELGIQSIAEKSVKVESKKYAERDLHLLLSTYLQGDNIHSKTIFHEKSLSSKDSNLNWVHPDMVGIKFLEFKEKTSLSLLKQINRSQIFDIFSFELKKEITNDYDLKQYFFQAVSNSSWANYGYLVAFEIINEQKIMDELERLSQSFGIGVIHLKANPYTSKILFPSKYRELDFKTLDKLSNANSDFKSFIMQLDKFLEAPREYSSASKKELIENCDEHLGNDTEIKEHCQKHHIPVEE